MSPGRGAELGGPGLVGWEGEFRSGNADWVVTVGCEGPPRAAARLPVNTQSLMATIIIIYFQSALALEEVIAPLEHI